MITEFDLQEAIAECKGTRNPNASTCIKLAAFLIIQRELYGSKEEAPAYSFSPAPPAVQSSYQSDTEFGKLVSGLNQEDVMPVMDELMTTLQVVQPRIYAAVIRQLSD